MTRPACLCGCGQTPKGETARFMIGHDARYKSQLIAAAMGGDADAVARLEEFGWTRFLEKRMNRVEKTVIRKKNVEAGLPASTVLITPEMSEDAVAGLILGNTIRVQHSLLNGKLQYSEDIPVCKIRCVAEGEIDFYVLDHIGDKGRPVPGQLRTVRVESIVGVVG